MVVVPRGNWMIPTALEHVKLWKRWVVVQFELTKQARALGIEVLVEVHSYFKQQVEIARQVDWVYDFALPPLVLHALYKADAQPLVEWLRVRPRNSITVLDTHDGIGVIDVGADGAGSPGLLQPAEIHDLVET